MAAFYPNFTRPLQLSLSKQREKKHDIEHWQWSGKWQERKCSASNSVSESHINVTTACHAMLNHNYKWVNGWQPTENHTKSRHGDIVTVSSSKHTIHNKNCTHACERKQSETNTTHKVSMIQCSLISKFIAEDCDLTSTQNMAMAQWTTRDFGRCQDMWKSCGKYISLHRS